MILGKVLLKTIGNLLNSCQLLICGLCQTNVKAKLGTDLPSVIKSTFGQAFLKAFQAQILFFGVDFDALPP